MNELNCDAENVTSPTYSWRREGRLLCLRQSGHTRLYTRDTNETFDCEVERELRSQIAEVISEYSNALNVMIWLNYTHVVIALLSSMIALFGVICMLFFVGLIFLFFLLLKNFV